MYVLHCDLNFKLGLVTVCVAGESVVTEQHREAMRECEITVKSSTQLLSQEHKDIHAPISKLGRSIDKVTTCMCVRDVVCWFHW